MPLRLGKQRHKQKRNVELRGLVKLRMRSVCSLSTLKAEFTLKSSGDRRSVLEVRLGSHAASRETHAVLKFMFHCCLLSGSLHHLRLSRLGSVCFGCKLAQTRARRGGRRARREGQLQRQPRHAAHHCLTLERGKRQEGGKLIAGDEVLRKVVQQQIVVHCVRWRGGGGRVMLLLAIGLHCSLGAK
eukprot:3656163-Rhodomonas_salina.2